MQNCNPAGENQGDVQQPAGRSRRSVVSSGSDRQQSNSRQQAAELRTMEKLRGRGSQKRQHSGGGSRKALFGAWIGRGGLQDEIGPGKWPLNRNRPEGPSRRDWAWEVAVESGIGRGGLESSSWPEWPCSAVPGTPGENVQVVAE